MNIYRKGAKSTVSMDSDYSENNLIFSEETNLLSILKF